MIELQPAVLYLKPTSLFLPSEAGENKSLLSSTGWPFRDQKSPVLPLPPHKCLLFSLLNIQKEGRRKGGGTRREEDPRQHSAPSPASLPHLAGGTEEER